MEAELRPPTAADIERWIDWSLPPLDAVPHGDRTLVVTYYTDIAGIPDCFGGLDERPLLALAEPGTDGLDPAAAVDGFVRAHLDMLDTWYQAIDSLDTRIRDSIGLPPWAAAFLHGEAEQLFIATSTLDRAVITHHHGSAGPRLSVAYGLAYPLSNGTISPFTQIDRA
ncbi:hypothetical protein [Streptomyces graminilatus]|uniref:hypothetical protein n=1 Tax=Streptomyces graminilatus TaxID=1464070 RepID=UPI0012FEF389|nr:hypothetical protein [Streptomyces graminilatus]